VTGRTAAASGRAGPSPRRRLKYLLLQVRNPGDPMRTQEVRCFARALHGAAADIAVFDLLSAYPTLSQLQACDVVLLGGSGDYAVSAGGAWLQPALDAMRELHAIAKPTFATCWGFQAMAQALGGHVVADAARAEIGTLPVALTPAGRADRVFGALAGAGERFLAQMGHQDIVERLPGGAVLLAHTDRAPQAYTFDGLPIYCTQFHPELDRESFLERVRHYPTYVTEITGLPYEVFERDHTLEAPHAGALLLRFLDVVFG
jgi:GMP synthase (glutamine-hydrolysing)